MFQTLDVLEQLCRDEQYSLLRLDGQTPTGKRQQLVERFNDRFSSVCEYITYHTSRTDHTIYTSVGSPWTGPSGSSGVLRVLLNSKPTGCSLSKS